MYCLEFASDYIFEHYSIWSIRKCSQSQYSELKIFKFLNWGENYKLRKPQIEKILADLDSRRRILQDSYVRSDTIQD